jgi:uncharacterized protein
MTMETIPLFEGGGSMGILFLVLIYFLSFFVKGVVGLGAMPPLVIFGAWVVEAHHAVLLAIILNTVTQLQFVPEIRRQADWSMGKGIVLAFAAALVAGVWVFGRLEAPNLAVVLGIALSGTLIADSLGWTERLIARIGPRSKVFGWAISALGGFLAGVTGAGGIMLLSLYVKAITPNPRVFRATILMVATSLMIWRFGVVTVAGFITLPLLVEAAVLIPAAMAGAWVGSRCFQGLKADLYYRALKVVLIIAALGLVWKGIAN